MKGKGQEYSTYSHHNQIREVRSQDIIQDWTNEQLQILIVRSDLLDLTMNLLKWRTKTTLPVVKPVKIILNPYNPSNILKLKNNNPITQQIHANKSLNHPNPSQVAMNSQQQSAKTQQYHFLIKIQHFKYRLNDLKLLPLCQSMYILKQMLTTFYQLYKMFGLFEPNDKMVIIDMKSKCKVWVNENFIENNKKQQKRPLNYDQFISKIIEIAEKHTYSTNISQLFYKTVRQIIKRLEKKYLVNSIIENMNHFIKENRISQVNKVVVIEMQFHQTMKIQKFKRQSKERPLQINDLPVNSAKYLVPFQYDEKAALNLQQELNRQNSKIQQKNMQNRTFKGPLSFFHKRLSNTSQGNYDKKIKSELHVQPRKSNKDQRMETRPLSFAETRFRIQSKILQRKSKRKEKYPEKFSYKSQKSINLHFLSNLKWNNDSTQKNRPSKNNKQEKNSYIRQENYIKLIDTAQNSQHFQSNIMDQYQSGKLKTPLAQKHEKNVYNNMKLNDLKKLTFGKDKRQNLTMKTERKIQTKDHRPRVSQHNKFQSKLHSINCEEIDQGKWNNTILSGLFSDNISIKYLKQSIKLQTFEDYVENKQVKHLKLELLSNFGRSAERSFHYQDDSMKKNEHDQIKHVEGLNKLINNSSIEFLIQNSFKPTHIAKQNSHIISSKEYLIYESLYSGNDLQI